MKAYCPFRVWCDFWFPAAGESERKARRENYELRTENARLRQIMIEEGINYGGSIYVEGQGHEKDH
jgi:hypothetical protein